MKMINIEMNQIVNQIDKNCYKCLYKYYIFIYINKSKIKDDNQQHIENRILSIYKQ
jgi:hypothetical protein